MSNLSLFKAAGLADVKSMASSLTALKRDAHTAPSLGGAALLKLDKGLGEWVYGVDSEEVGTQRVAINPASFTRGWVIWGDAEILLEGMASVALDMPERPEPIAGNEPKLQLGFMAALEDGTQLIYKTTALGGREFVQELASVIGERITSGADDCVPLLELAASHYRHKKYGRIYKPDFTVVAWAGSTEEKEEEAPRPRRRRV
jgi:hypothetical protein